MNEKVLMYRYKGDKKWLEYIDGEEMEIDDYKVGKVYKVEYKVIEKEKKQ